MKKGPTNQNTIATRVETMLKTYDTLVVRAQSQVWRLTINRPDSQNTLNTQVLKELNDVLDEAALRPECRVIILEGQDRASNGPSGGVFCTGMDFAEMSKLCLQGDPSAIADWTSYYMSTLKRLSFGPKITMAKIDGKVLAGGVGLAAACDLVVSSEAATFALSEACWGLLPAMVMPFLVRRVGLQCAYRMTLSMQAVSAKEAHLFHLVDELSSELDQTVDRLLKRLLRLDESTLINMKVYFRKMWIVTEEMENEAVAETTRLLHDPIVQKKIRNFVEKNILPWEKNA